MSKYTKADIKTLAGFLKHAKGDNAFALIAGAGCSLSAGIPLAVELVKEINERFEHCVATLSENDRKNYGKCMAKLDKAERQQLLSPYLSEAKINWSNIAIAAMLDAGFLSRVLTFNFDDVLARACGISGLYPATYDFVTGASNTVDHIVTPAIVHLHGQGSGLAMLNSDEETKEHAERLRPLLTDTMARFPILILGYSGEADSVFPVLSECYSGHRRLFWAGYADDAARHVADFIRPYSQTNRYFGGADADLFLIELARELGCWPPAIFSDPLKHLRSEVESVTPFPNTKARTEKSAGSDDVLKALHDTLSAYEKESPGTSKADSELLFVGAMLKGDYERAVAAKPDSHEALNNWGNALFELAKQEKNKDLFEQSFEKYAAALEIKPDDHEALNNWGNVLLSLARQEKDKDLFEQSFEKYAASLEIKPDQHEALYNWGNALSDLAEQEKDKGLFEQSFEKYAASLEIKPDKHVALNNWGNALLNLARQEKDKDLFEQSFEKYAASLEIKPDKLEALYNWGNALSDVARQEKDKGLFEQSFEKYAAALEIKPDQHEALYNWGNALSDLARQEKDKGLFEQSFEKYAASLEIKPDQHEALNNWGNALLDLAKQEKDKGLFEQSFEKYAASLEIKPDTYEALNNWGIALLKYWRLNKQTSTLVAARDVFAKAVSLQPEDLYNLACLEALEGNFETACEHLEACHRFGTLPSKEHLESDEDMESLLELPRFQKLIAKL